MAKSTLSQEKLKEFLRYDEDAGTFAWIKRPPYSNRLKLGGNAGTLSPNGYLYIGIFRELYLAHRLAWFYVHGVWPSGQIDHINHDRADNRIANLRVVTVEQNHRNKKKRADNTSGVNGVHFDKKSKRWIAQSWNGNKRLHLGCFATLEEAASKKKFSDMLSGYHYNHGT